MRSIFCRCATVVALAALVAVPTAARQAATRPPVALLDFDFGTVDHWWSGTVDVGKGIAALVEEELVNDGSFRVFDRSRLDKILAEQNFNESDRVDPTGKAAKIGKALGVKYLIAGTITKFGTENSSKGVGGGGFGSRFGVGSVGTSSGKATVAVTLKVIDSSTTEIVVIAKGEGTSKRSGLMLAGAGGGGGKAGAGGLNFGASDFKDTIIGEATQNCVKDLMTKFLAKKANIR